MGHFCRICECSRPNEAFSGKGHQNHICKECARLPQEERDYALQMDEIFHFLEQSHISVKNVARLQKLAASKTPEIATNAAITLEVAQVKPYKRRRLKFLAQKHPDLLRKLQQTGLILAHDWDASLDFEFGTIGEHEETHEPHDTHESMNPTNGNALASRRGAELAEDWDF